MWTKQWEWSNIYSTKEQKVKIMPWQEEKSNPVFNILVSLLTHSPSTVWGLGNWHLGQLLLWQTNGPDFPFNQWEFWLYISLLSLCQWFYNLTNSLSFVNRWLITYMTHDSAKTSPLLEFPTFRPSCTWSQKFSLIYICFFTYM